MTFDFSPEKPKKIHQKSSHTIHKPQTNLKQQWSNNWILALDQNEWKITENRTWNDHLNKMNKINKQTVKSEWMIWSLSSLLLMMIMIIDYNLSRNNIIIIVFSLVLAKGRPLYNTFLWPILLFFFSHTNWLTVCVFGLCKFA